MARFNQLNTFKDNELIFDDEETIVILKFIFKSQHALIDQMEVNNKVKEFAQALLVEAIDASAALWAIDAVFRSAMSPGQSAKKVLSKMGQQAAKKWFKHATSSDLKHVKIYDIIRNQLASHFRPKLTELASGLHLGKSKKFIYSPHLFKIAAAGIVWRG